MDDHPYARMGVTRLWVSEIHEYEFTDEVSNDQHNDYCNSFANRM
jgi:hypothetical protein